MPKYMVGVKEMHIQYIEVEAQDMDDAVEKARQGDGTEKEIEYSCTLDSDDWTVNEVKKG